MAGLKIKKKGKKLHISLDYFQKANRTPWEMRLCKPLARGVESYVIADDYSVATCIACIKKWNKLRPGQKIKIDTEKKKKPGHLATTK